MGQVIDTTQSDFSEMDNASISKEHWKIMLISGMGFFTDAYDLFVIGVVMSLLKPLWHVGKVEEGLVTSTALDRVFSIAAIDLNPTQVNILGLQDQAIR
jgi:hypothetical protein